MFDIVEVTELSEALLNDKCIAGDNGEYVTFIEME